MAKDQRDMSSTPTGGAPSAFAGVPTPNLPPLPPPVSSASGSPTGSVAPPAPPVEAQPGASVATAPPPAAPTPAAPPAATEPFNDVRDSLGGGGFNPRLLAIPVILLLVAGGWFLNRGTTMADDLAAGDCFVMPSSAGEFERLDTEDCSNPHDGQIFAAVSLPGPTTYPAESDPYWQAVFNACIERAAEDLVRVDEIPADFELNFFSPVAAGWEQADDRESLCYIHAPSGLAGSHLG